jgi:hypothetical protein
MCPIAVAVMQRGGMTRKSGATSKPIGKHLKHGAKMFTAHEIARGNIFKNFRKMLPRI